MLDYDDVDAATRERFHGVIRDEVRTMSQRIQQLANHTTQTLKTRWPLEDMLGADLLAAACRRIETQQGCRAAADDVDPALWLKVDSYSLLKALQYLAGRLVEEYDVTLVRLRLARSEGRARLDLVWSGHAMSTETVTGWETEPMRIGTRQPGADPARRGRAPRRRVLVRARARAPRVAFSPAAAAGGQRRTARRRAVRAQREPPRGLRLRPVSHQRAGAANWPTGGWRT